MEFTTNWSKVFPLDSARTCPNAVSCVNVVVFGMFAMLRCALVGNRSGATFYVQLDQGFELRYPRR